ncbi:hypothetical protein ACLK1T_03180 [Escherichia coli]
METAYATAVSASFRTESRGGRIAASTSRIVMMKTGCATPVSARVGLQ